ncbi:MAG: hypothetical protein WC346_10175 [Methanogenium sp.]
MKSSDFDIIRYLQDRNVVITYSGKNVSRGWIGINCIFCIDPSNHLGINLQSKAFSCHKCAEKGNAIQFIQAMDGVSTSVAISIMKQYEGGAFVPAEKHYQEKVKMPIGASKKFHENHLRYLEYRRFNPDRVIKEYDLFATGPIGDYKHRIIIPVKFNNRLISFVGRDITGQAQIPYKNSSENYSIKDVKQSLYNMDSVLLNRAVIVEGIFDAWRIGDGAVATFGTKYTREQLRLLKGLKQVFVLYDADAIPIAHKLAYDLTSLVRQVEVLELSEGDPDNLTDDDVRALRKDIGL